MVRCFKAVLGALALTAMISSVAGAAGGPVIGTYRSTDLGGALLTGRASQSWGAAANALHGNGDVYHAQSWNGAALGTQWDFTCGLQNAPQSVLDTRVAGTGVVYFTNTFVGGTYNFANGPWCTAANCSGLTNQTLEQVQVQYVSNIPMASVVNINTSGHFDNSNCNLTFAIANGFGQGDTDGGAFPVGQYPSLLAPGCAPTRTFGSWGDVITITARIDCPVPVRTSTWGQLKQSYR